MSQKLRGDLEFLIESSGSDKGLVVTPTQGAFILGADHFNMTGSSTEPTMALPNRKLLKTG